MYSKYTYTYHIYLNDLFYTVLQVNTEADYLVARA